MSKITWQHPEISGEETTVSWRSPGQLENTPAFREWLDREFPEGASEMQLEGNLETTRRSFLKWMGASSALAGLGMASCRRPEAYIVPYTKAPEWVIPGKATYYATSMPRATGAVPLVVTSFEGRPTKLAPNRQHPDAAGTDAWAQASILELYSISRSREILHQGKTAKREDVAAVLAGIAVNPAAKVGIVVGHDDSPTRTRLLKEVSAKYAGAKIYRYEALVNESQTALGKGKKAVVDFAKADRILSLDCDFAGVDPQGPVTGFFDRRKPEGKQYQQKPQADGMNRLYQVESAFSLTGGMADHRLRVTPSQVLAIAAAVAGQLGIAVPAIPSIDSRWLEWIAPMVKDLKEHAGKCVVLAGSRQPLAVQQLALAMNVLLGNIGEGKPMSIYQLEQDAYGDLVSLKKDIESGAIETLFMMTPSNPIFDAPADLRFAEVYAKVATTIHLGERVDATANASTWHIPAAHYLESWGDTKTSNGIHTVVQPMILPLYADCSSGLEILCALLSVDGKWVIGEGAQGAATPAYAAVRKTFAEIAGDGDAVWKTFLKEGYSSKTRYPVANVAGVDAAHQAEIATAVSSLSQLSPATAASLEVVFATDASIFDGRYIDNPWLQESPDPVSKLTWDNVATLAPKTAKELGIYDQIIELETKYASVGPDGEGEKRQQPMIELSVNGAKLAIPVMISFGQAENTVVIPVGYGQGYDSEDVLKRSTQERTNVGLVGVNTGFNVYPLRTTSSLYFATGAKLSKLSATYPVAVTQEHHSMYGRALAREVSTGEEFSSSLAGVKKQGNDSHAPVNIAQYKPMGSAKWHADRAGNAKPHLSDDLHQWGMTIDLSACMGCNACQVACQAENNIPIVGKEQVAKGREMHWIRMDRYYAVQTGNTFDADNPSFIPQPVACVHCESAPCESVCPVNATIHTEDGLNAMAYNRCIGTRYCANNCPYKARRFNFFDYNKRNPLIHKNLYRGPLGETAVGDSEHLQKNPNVTVRMRGVMEKCTFCVQRLKDAVIRQKAGQKNDALLAGKSSVDVQVTEKTLRIPVDSVRTACQEACPAEAIAFGNRLDGDASVMGRARAIERSYDLLNYIGTRPRTQYLARVKNPNAGMPDAKYIGQATIHMH